MKLFRPTRFNVWDGGIVGVRVFYGGKTQQSSSQVSIPPEVLAQYQNVNSIANQVAKTPFSQYSTNPNAFVAPLTATQQAGVLGTSQYSTEAQPFYQTAATMNQNASAPLTQAGITNYMNPYEQSVIQPTENLLNQQFAQAQSGQLGNAINQGAFGGDRAAVTAANLQEQQGLAYGQTIGGLLNQNYQQAVGTAQEQQQIGQAGANNEANIGAGAQSSGLAGAQAQLTAGQSQQQTEQAGLTALYNQFLQQQSYPFQTTQFLGNIAEGTGALSGSTTNSTQPAPFFSDERLKEDIEPIGKTYDGEKIVKFRYKGKPDTQIGLIAQDVEKRHPDAVGLAGGYKTVDYDAATRHASELGRHSRGLGGAAESQGGRVLPFPERRAYDGGGYAGLSPNSAWSAGFYVDPSYLNAQEQSYATAPWGNAGPVTGSSPYGGKSHVPPPSGGTHAALSVSRPPAQQPSGLQQLANEASQVEKLGKAGQGLWNGAQGLMPQSTASTSPAPAMGSTGAAPVSQGSTGSSGSVSPVSDASDYIDPAFMNSARGGLVQRDDGGSVDQSPGGDIPYDSGTGMSGLDIPDDSPKNKLATAQPPSTSSSGNGLGSVASLVGDVLPFIPGLKTGGRIGLAGGGTADEDQSNAGAPELPQPGQGQSDVIPGMPLRQDDPGGVASFLNRNQGLIAPALHGLGAMASSNSRYLGSAILQGLGGAADSYENVQNEMANRGLTGASIGQAGAQTGLLGAETGRAQAQTGGVNLQNEQFRQALASGDIDVEKNVVRMPGGTNMMLGDWYAAGQPPTAHQVNQQHQPPSVAGTTGPKPPAPPPAQYSQLGDAGKTAVGQDAATLRPAFNTPAGLALKNQSQQTENDLQKRYDAAVQSGKVLNQSASAIENMPDSGVLAGGPLMAMRRELVMKYNDAMTTMGMPGKTIDPDEAATAVNVDKLHGLMSFATTHGMDQDSATALAKAEATNPGTGLPKNAAIKVLAGLYALKQPDIDRYNYLNEYKQEAQSQHPGMPNWYLAQHATTAFNSDHDDTQYGQEKQNIENLLSAKSSQGNTILNGVYHKQFSPQQMQQLEGAYGKGIFRYFRNN